MMIMTSHLQLLQPNTHKLKNILEQNLNAIIIRFYLGVLSVIS